MTIQSGGRSFTAAFADALIEIAQQDPRVFALTAAMPDGTGLNKFQKALPERFLDGGIRDVEANPHRASPSELVW